MSVLTAPVAADPHSRLARANPVAKLLAALVLLVVLLAAVDPVTPALALAGELAAVPLLGVSTRTLLRRCWPLLLGAVGVAWVNALFAADQGGPALLAAGPVRVGEAAALAGAALGLRVIAVALPGVLVLATTDPTDLADSLVAQARVSPRFAYGALAALRLLPLLAREWETIGRARRARGVDAGRSPLTAGRLFAGAVLTLLVGAVRRGTRLATAMEARGFGARPQRTCAREVRVRGSDRLLVLGAAGLGLAATAVSMALGTWTPLGA